MCFCVQHIQDGCQKWWENAYTNKSLVESADTLCFQNIVEIALPHVSKKNAFWRLLQKFKMLAKNGG